MKKKILIRWATALDSADVNRKTAGCLNFKSKQPLRRRRCGVGLFEFQKQSTAPLNGLITLPGGGTAPSVNDSKVEGSFPKKSPPLLLLLPSPTLRLPSFSSALLLLVRSEVVGTQALRSAPP